MCANALVELAANESRFAASIGMLPGARSSFPNMRKSPKHQKLAKVSQRRENEKTLTHSLTRAEVDLLGSTRVWNHLYGGADVSLWPHSRIIVLNATAPTGASIEHRPLRFVALTCSVECTVAFIALIFVFLACAENHERSRGSHAAAAHAASRHAGGAPCDEGA